MSKQLNEKQVMRQIEYWIESSETDYKAMNNSYASRDYVWSLFIEVGTRKPPLFISEDELCL